MSGIILGGVEGGATKTIVYLMNEQGAVLAEAMGSSTNPWNVGLEKCCEHIFNLVTEAKIQAQIPKDMSLHSLGLCISGVETDDIKKKIQDTLQNNYPSLSENYYVSSDTRAPLAMVSDKGGIVLISGTGSNCLLINTDESEVQCGGFGDRLGDEGSAFWMAYRGIKICLDSNMNFNFPPNCCSNVKLWNAIKNHFNIETVFDLIPLFYSRYNKTDVAAFCIPMATLARDGDPLSKWIFECAGKYLAKHIQAIYNSADESLKKEKGGLQVVCVGSVWHSWDLLKPGFETQLKDTSVSDIRKLSLVQTTKSSAIGAVYLAARVINLTFPYSFSKNYKVFYVYVR